MEQKPENAPDRHHLSLSTCSFSMDAMLVHSTLQSELHGGAHTAAWAVHFPFGGTAFSEALPARHCHAEYTQILPQC